MSVVESVVFSSKLICTFISSKTCCIVSVFQVLGLEQVSCEAGIGKEIVLPEFCSSPTLYFNAANEVLMLIITSL
jgi:hypothetical protein